MRILNRFLSIPIIFTIIIITALLSVFYLFKLYGAGTEFFPSIEPEIAQIQIRARGNLSVYEKDEIVKEVEQRMLAMKDEVKYILPHALVKSL